MKQYNIYAGKKGNPNYLYTDYFEDTSSALKDAEYEMHYLYELDPYTKKWKDSVLEIAKFKNIRTCDLVRVALDYLHTCYLDWGEYNAVLTTEDSIPNDDLILAYVEQSC